MSKANHTLLFVLVIAIVALTLNGCGWHLRGSMDKAMALPPLYLEIQSGSAELRSELPQALSSAGVELVAKRESAPMILVIHDETMQRHVLAVGSGGKVSDYELLYLLHFSVRDQSGKEVIAPDTIRQQRDYSYDANAVLAKGEEEQQLFSFMRSMAIQTLLRRMQGLSRSEQKPATTTESKPGAN